MPIRKMVLPMLHLTALVFFVSFSSAAATELPLIKIFTSETEVNAGSNVGEELYQDRKDRLTAFLKEKGVRYEIIKMPWQRAYKKVAEDPFALIYPLTRSKLREDKFDWIKKLSDNEFYLIGHKSYLDLKLDKKEITSGNYNVVCVKNAISCFLADEFGFPKEAIFKIEWGYKSSLPKMVAHSRGHFLIENMEVLGKLLSPTVMASLTRVGDYVFRYDDFLAGMNTDPALLEFLTRASSKE